MEYLLSYSQSWLDPSGNFHPVPKDTNIGGSFLTHEKWAKQNGFTLNKLYSSGWMRISKYGDTLWANNLKKLTLNDRQLSNLKEFAKSNNKINTIAFDNGEKESILWSKDDEYYESFKFFFKNWLINN